MTPPPSIADAHVLCLPAGVSLAAWHARGRLDQALPLLTRLATAPLGLTLLATPGDPPPPLPEGIALIETDSPEQGAQALADRYAHRAGGANVLVRTVQLDDAGLGEAIADRLAAAGATVARMARAGHLRSRFLARQLGADHPETQRAGQTERDLCRAANIVVGTTGKMVDDLAWRWGLPDARLRVIPNFVDDEAPIGEPEHRDPGRVLVVGPLLRHKNTDVILRAIGAMPRAARGGLTLEVVGDGPERGPLEALAAELGVNADFRGTLPHPEALARMRVCAAYVQASAYEGHPLAVIEAMAAGAAVVVANTPGLGIVVDNGVSGVLVPGNAESFTYALSGVLEDDGWREMLGRSAAVAARRRFGISQVYQLDEEAQRAALGLVAPAARAA